MSTTKMYAVIIAEPWVNTLAPIVRHWVKQYEGLFYLISPRVNPDGPYFHLVLREIAPDNKPIELELQIPHGAILGVLYAADLKKIGFV